ncbi:error-prone DNA polymerase [Pendulispora albinea]|uniref:Error-prone DNA polymerase n=1 Tax=Pendulispora albinea TaxID=2741071 RepID=A0ABZ2LQ68_9BACT
MSDSTPPDIAAPNAVVLPFRKSPSNPSPAPEATTAPPKSHFVELWTRTNFSFLMGASSPETLVERAANLGYDTLGIADRDGLYGIVRALQAGEKLGVRIVLGCELTVLDGASFHTLLVVVQNHAGYTNLCRVLTDSHGRHRKGKANPFRPTSRWGEPLPRNLYAGLPFSAIANHAEGLWAVVHPDSPPAHASMVKEAFGERASVGLYRHLDGEDFARTRDAAALSEQFDMPLVASNRVLFATPPDKRILDVLHCIREGCTLDQAGRALMRNTEAHLKPEASMRVLFKDHPQALARARDIADACRFSMKELKYQFPVGSYAAKGETCNETLRRLTYIGAEERYGKSVPEAVREQIEKELALIEKIDKAPYFLSVRSIVEIAKDKDILCQGRGSAANSAVCYCLGITAVDPSRSNLLFERFISVERHEPPDIDVDFEHERREEVIQEIYATYGRERAAMVSEVICYRGKSALREVGKVFGFSLEQVDRLAAVVSWWDKVKEVRDARLAAVGFDPDDGRVRAALACAVAIQGFPRHLSIHVGGFVLSAEPLDAVAPVEPATMKDRTIIPWDKDDLDTLGFFKVDVLGLGMLTVIRKTLELVQACDPSVRAEKKVERLTKIPSEDPQVYEALCRADTVGVFQIESRAQMAMLPRLRPEEFYDLVIEVAIVRPGPIQGGMVHPYLRRRSGEEKATMPHASLEPILKRTLGVPLFQEQVMQIAITGAGYTAGQADELRRDMAAWRRSGRLEQHRERLARGFAEHGIEKEFAERLFSQIEGFGEYGFPESHAASFALLVYASAWLKVHHPAPFAAALINSQPMGFYSPSTILQDAQRHGVTVLPISIDVSQWDCTLEAGAIRAGLRLVKGLGEKSYASIAEARCAKPFESVEDFASRTRLTQRELEVVAESGALAPLVSREAMRLARGPRNADAFAAGRAVREAMWMVREPRGIGLFEGKRAESADADADNAKNAESAENAESPRPARPLPAFSPLTRAEQLTLDYERTGFSATDHPMKLLRPKLARQKVQSSRELLTIPPGQRVKTAGYVICRQRPGTASGVVFITMEDESGFINLVLWNRIFDAYRQIATTSPLLLVRGKLEREKEVVHVMVESMASLSLSREDGSIHSKRASAPRAGSSEVLPFHGKSRDFH